MARIEKVKDSLLMRIYNVEGTVGFNIQSKRDDVLLVQVLLRMIYPNSNYFPDGLNKDVSLPPITGHCGITTSMWISTFQLDQGMAPKMQANGIVNHARTPKVRSPITGDFYLIYLLNLICSTRNTSEYLRLMNIGLHPMIFSLGAED